MDATLRKLLDQLNDNYCLVSPASVEINSRRLLLGSFHIWSHKSLGMVFFVHCSLIDLVAINKIVLIVCLCWILLYASVFRLLAWLPAFIRLLAVVFYSNIYTRTR